MEPHVSCAMAAMPSQQFCSFLFFSRLCTAFFLVQLFVFTAAPIYSTEEPFLRATFGKKRLAIGDKSCEKENLKLCPLAPCVHFHLA